jgi:hypothetical protein
VTCLVGGSCAGFVAALEPPTALVDVVSIRAAHWIHGHRGDGRPIPASHMSARSRTADGDGRGSAVGSLS